MSTIAATAGTSALVGLIKSYLSSRAIKSTSDFMEVFVKDKFYKKICKYPKFVQHHILKSIELLKEFPFARLDIKKLAGKDDIFRLRIGNYRIFFILEENKIYVFDAEVREKAYK